MRRICDTLGQLLTSGALHVSPVLLLAQLVVAVDSATELRIAQAIGAPMLATAIGARAASAPTNVAFVLSEGATVIDFAGPWEVFQDAQPSDASTRDLGGYRLFTVARDLSPIVASAGLAAHQRQSLARS